MYDLVHRSVWGYPIIETAHVFGIAMWVGSIVVLDLRLMGVTRRTPFYHYHLVPWAYAGAVITIATGVLFVLGDPQSHLANPAFWTKMALIVIATGLAMVFHTRLVSTHVDLAEDVAPPAVARLAGAASMLIWFGVVVAARMIPYSASASV